jgi:hypothetical protein
VNLVVPPGVDIYTTSTMQDGEVLRPPGDNWSLAGVLEGNGLVFIWTRSRIYAEHEEKLAAQAADGKTWITSPAIGIELALGRPCPVCHATPGEKCRFDSGEPTFSFHRARSGASLDESPVSATADTQPAGGVSPECVICRQIADMPGTTAVCGIHKIREAAPVESKAAATPTPKVKPERPKLPKDFW